MQLLYIFVCAATFFGLVYLKVKLNKQRHYEQQKKGILYIKEIKSIITLAQQHRGLSAAKIQGDQSVEEKLTQIKSAIASATERLMGREIITNERWLGFCDHWSRLNATANNLTLEKSFEQHTALIQNLIYLLEDTAENTRLTAKYLPQLPKVGYVWRELVFIAENIGQSRAIGMAVATERKCTYVNKIKLNFLIQNMQSAEQYTLQQLPSLTTNQQSHTQVISHACDKINGLISVIDHQLIKPSKITIVNTDYFALATDTIMALNQVFEQQIKQLETIIEKKH